MSLQVHNSPVEAGGKRCIGLWWRVITVFVVSSKSTVERPKKQENQGVTKWPSQGLDLNPTLKWFGRTLRTLCVNKRMQTLTNQSNTVKKSESYTTVCDTNKVIDARSTIYLTLACMWSLLHITLRPLIKLYKIIHHWMWLVIISVYAKVGNV